MTRKTSTALLLAACALAACTHSSSTGSAPARGPRPNVLLVVTDDQTVNEMAVMAHARRWLSRGGVTFDHAFVTTPQCCPSRASILSGRFAHNTGVKDNFDAAKLNQATTVEHLLRSSGYETAIFGKFLNSWDMRRDPPFFDRWAITSHSGRGYREGRWNVQGRMRTVHAYNTDFLFRKTRRFISSADTPWFAYLATAASHAPFRAAPGHARRAVPRWRPNPAVRERHRSDKPGFVRAQHLEMRRVKTVYKQQERTLLSVDGLMARLHRLLKDRGELDRTLVIYTSDNGLLLGEHGLSAKKAVPYTGSISVPLLMSWPGHLPRGEVRNDLVTNVDIAPTIVAAARLRPPRHPPMDGRSLLAPVHRQRVLTEFWSRAGRPFPEWASLRTRSFQYVEYYWRPGGRPEFREYYDLRRDPWENHNLLAGPRRHGPEVRALARRLARLRRCEGASCP